MILSLSMLDFLIFFFAFLFLFSIAAIIAAILMIKHNMKIRKYIEEHTETAYLLDKYESDRKYHITLRERSGAIKNLIVKKKCFNDVVPLNEIKIAILDDVLLFYEQDVIIEEELETDESLL